MNIVELRNLAKRYGRNQILRDVSLSVEPGDFTRDNDANLRSLQQMKALVARYPQIDVRVGHQR